MNAPDVQIVDDPARVCADALVEAARTGRHVVLTGGSTPKQAYELAAQRPKAFSGSRLWFGDERCVPPGDERSNFGMAKAALLDPVEAAGVQIGFCHRMEGEIGPDLGAEAYERKLDEEQVREFELVLLGIGPDGHTASLFPGQETVMVRDRRVVGVHAAGLEPYVPRVSFTLPAIGAARRVMLVATGESKADAVSWAFGSDARPSPKVPSSMLPEFVENLVVVLDREAAARL